MEENDKKKLKILADSSEYQWIISRVESEARKINIQEAVKQAVEERKYITLPEFEVGRKSSQQTGEEIVL